MGRYRMTAALAATVAAGLAMLLMFWARAALQVRTLPERIMEAALLLVPPDQFESAVQRFGPQAKEYALYVATLAMFAGLLAIGLAAFLLLRRPVWLLTVGVGLWLVAMVVIMPLT